MTIVGIDLGTSTSEIALLKNGKPMLIREIAGGPHGILPSIVAIDTNGELKVGDLAEKTLIPRPEFATQEVKRKMGTDVKIPLGSEEFSPQEISAMILRHLKQEAEKYLGSAVTEAVITVPAHFNALERRATRDAGELAGLSVRRLLNEPTAAALAYGIDRLGTEEKVVVYDLGGGTLDVTVLELSEGILDVLASTGNTQLGGKNFDELLMGHLRNKCRKETGVDLQSTATELKNRLRFQGLLKSAAKRAKEELSSVTSTHVSLPFIGMDRDGSPISFDGELTRQELDGLIGGLVESTREQLDEALAAKGLMPQDINTVLMVGGSTRVPLVRHFVSNYFGGRTLRTEVHPDEAVALGAAVLSGILDRTIASETMVITDVANWTLGVSVIGEREGEWSDDAFDPLIERFSTIPRTAKKTYRTAHDGQKVVRVEVYQGDDALCANNELIGTLDLAVLEPGPAGQPIEIEFSYDLNEELEVVARDIRSGRHARTRIQPSPNRMSDGEKRTARERLETRWQRRSSAPLPSADAGSSSSRSTTNPGGSAAAVDASKADWRQSPDYASVSALIAHTEKRLPALETRHRIQASKLIDSMKAALASGNTRELRASEQKLTDLLFDLE